MIHVGLLMYADAIVNMIVFRDFFVEI